MALYLYQHPETQEVIEVIQKMTDEHIYISADGVKYDRLWTKPGANFDTIVNPLNSKDFLKRTANRKGGTMGEIWDESRELSERREHIVGKDFIKEKYQKDWSSKRHGKIYPSSSDKTFEI